MKLSDLPNGSALRVVTKEDKVEHNATFHHLDGLYSYCTIDDRPAGKNVFNLHFNTPVKLVNGRYEIGSES